MSLPPPEILRTRAPPDDTVVVVRGGVVSLREAGFEVMPTFTNRYHFSIVLPDATARTFAELRRRFSAPIANPGYTPG